MKAAIYVRVSTPGQAEKGESIELQKEECLRYIKFQKWDLYRIYEDAGYSGKDVNRPAFKQLIADAQLRKFDVVVIYKIDRLSRSVIDFYNTVELFKKNNISFVSITQKFDTTTSTGQLSLNILAAFADFERSIGVERSIDSYKRRVREGIPSGALPYGYKREGKNATIVPEEAEKVKKIFELAGLGYTMNRIARETGFTSYHVRSILTNPFYAGYLVRRRDSHDKRIREADWQWIKGKHEPIIDMKTWNLVSSSRKQKIRVPVRSTVGIFARLIYCTSCFHNLCFHSRHRKSGIRYYYQCDKITMDGKSCGLYIREEPLEAILLGFVDKSYNIKVSQVSTKKQIQAQKQLEDIEKKIERIVSLVESGLIDIEKAKDRLRRLQEEKASIVSIEIVKEDFPDIIEKLNSFKSIYSLATREQKQVLWHALIERIDCYPDKLVVKWRFKKKQTIQLEKIRSLLKKKAKSKSAPVSGSNPPAATIQRPLVPIPLSILANLSRLKVYFLFPRQ